MNNCFGDFSFDSLIQCLEELEFGLGFWLLIVTWVVFRLDVIHVVFWPFCRVFDISLAVYEGLVIFDKTVPRSYYPFLIRIFVLIEVNFSRT